MVTLVETLHGVINVMYIVTRIYILPGYITSGKCDIVSWISMVEPVVWYILSMV